MGDRVAGAAGGEAIGWGMRVVILAGGPAIALASSIIQPILPKIAADLAHTPDELFLVKMLIGVMGVAMVIGATLTGFLADRFGLKRIMVANYAGYALAGTAGVYLQDLHLLIVSRFFLGVAAAGAVTGSIIVINAQLPADRRANWLGYYNAVAQMSSVVLNPVSGVLGEFNWHWSFAIYGLAAPFAVLAAVVLAGKDQPTASAEVDPSTSASLIRWFPFRFAAIAVLIGLVMYMPMVYLPFLLNDLGMRSPTLISLVLTGDIIAGSIAAMFYGRARRSLSERQTFATAFAFAGCGLVIASAAPGYTLVIIGSIFFGIGVAWFLPSLLSAVSTRVTAEQQGRGAGLIKSAVYLGSPIAVFLAEPIARSYGPRGAILAAGLIALLLVVITLGSLSRRNVAAVLATD